MSNGVIAGEQLRLFLERIERLQEEKKGIGDDIRDVFSEAKSQGFDTKIMKKLIKLRAQSEDDRAEEAALLETYARAIGLGGTPLGDYFDKPEQKKAA